MGLNDRYVYAANAGIVRVYRMDQGTGALTLSDSQPTAASASGVALVNVYSFNKNIWRNRASRRIQKHVQPLAQSVSSGICLKRPSQTTA